MKKAKRLTPWALIILSYLSLIASLFVPSMALGFWLPGGAFILLWASAALRVSSARLRKAMWIVAVLMVLALVTATLLPPMWLIPEQRHIFQTTGWHQIGPDTWEAEWESFTYTCYRGNIKLDFEHHCNWAMQVEKALQAIGLMPNLSPVPVP